MKTRFSVLCALLLFAVPVLAQMAAPPTVPSANRLPADTWVLLVWHGSAPMDKVRATNAVLRLWDDPEFKPARDSLTQMIYGEIEKDQKDGKANLTREDLDDFISILENPLVLGIAGNPIQGMMAAKSPAYYGIYNRTGKADLLAKLQKKSDQKPNTEKSAYTFEGVEVLKSVTTTPVEPEKTMDPEEGKEDPEEQAPPKEPKVTTTFKATAGTYELFSSDQATIEGLITRLSAGAPPVESLAGNKTFQAAQGFRASGTLFEALVILPNLTAVPIPPNEKFDAGAAIRELHVERLHGLTMSAGLTADTTLMRAAMLGDTTPGSLFDMVSADAAEFHTPAIAPANSSLAVFRLDLPALYATLQRAAKAGLPPDQAAMADMLDGMVAMQTGMPLTQILGLFTGEIAVISTGEDALAEVLPDTIAISVTDGEPMLTLLRTVLSARITGEEAVPGATLLTLTPPAAPPTAEGTPAKAPTPFYVAVASKMLLVSQARPQIDAALARLASGDPAPAGSMAAAPGFQKARKAMPATVSGFSYGDYTTFPWEKQREAMKKQFAEQKRDLLEKADAAMKGSEEVAANPESAAALRKQAEQLDVMAKFADAMFPLVKRYLHAAVGVWRKAPDGLFMEGAVD